MKRLYGNKHMKKIPLYDVRLHKKTIQQVNKVLRSGWLSPGENIKNFEKQIGQLLDMPYAVAVSSATDGLIVALRTLEIGAGDEVITTPFTFVATVEAVIAVGAKPVLVDIEYDSLNIDPDLIERKLSKRTKAIIPVDIAGLPCDYKALRKICKKHKLYLISDSAHTIGSRYKHKAIGRFTDMSVISFHVTKNLLCGEGGMIVTTKKQLAIKARLIANHGIVNNAMVRKRTGAVTYDIKEAGLKANMSELHAAVGLGQLASFPSEQKKREGIAKHYAQKLSSLEPFIELPKVETHSNHGWYLYIIKLNLSRLRLTRNRFLALLKDAGIEGGIHYRPLTEMSYYKKRYTWSAGQFPQSTKAGQSIISLPLYPSLSLTEVDYICDVIKDIVRRYQK